MRWGILRMGRIGTGRTRQLIRAGKGEQGRQAEKGQRSQDECEKFYLGRHTLFHLPSFPVRMRPMTGGIQTVLRNLCLNPALDVNAALRHPALPFRHGRLLPLPAIRI